MIALAILFMKYISHNGKLVNPEQATIPVLSKAMFFNFAVYESIKVVAGKGFFTEYHIDRLLHSASLIGLEHSFSKKNILRWIDDLSKNSENKDLLIRILLMGAGDENEEPQLFMFPLGLTFYPDKFYRRGVKVITYEGERMLPQAKSKDLLLNFLAHRVAVKSDALDAILVDRGGNMREGTRTNLFAIKGNSLVTSPVDKVLDGITRRILFEAVRGDEKLSVVEEDIPLKDIENYDGFFLTSTSMNVMPIRQIDDVVIAKEVHPKIKEIAKRFKQYSQSHT
ncbi:MAG: hypothetical protein A3E37_02025 [Candidatus Andersenbacteria bacterium RIFCSPHIGHO2_12_FULL_46_9]|nr:MAG: Aminotransferase class IV [Parcubacteria group bacterium GW2011_GWA2_45_14]OGY33909.1 MAG: hypothetical protein A3B76_01530 [Candidatus Andersenbacteria bacterium RIFCSPHIGHO2_02_FULL_46_16]OGY36038.1 MAG: hypothetical protein A3I08_02920 [Candidatus Andersenbacteria bacterium RIFCSPLOWO2_02_FULL_46_11]OGY36811.1 MAG: hypothetical protein A3E37_02025 [Candidatus Andersenbacteria bacterium RIFCSPHIGHO2_12_FULL_46_9]HBE89989.1 hypothetical protein [Candidatus Andersenbacteria bacterium]